MMMNKMERYEEQLKYGERLIFKIKHKDFYKEDLK